MKKKLLLFVLCCSTSILVAQNLKVISYNLGDGVGQKRGSIQRFQQYIKQLDVDVAAFQHLEGMSEAGLKTWAKKWKHPYVSILQSEAYALAITSKYPLENTKQIKTGLEYGYLYTEVAGLGIYTTQLTNKSPKARKAEAGIIAKDVANNGQKALVLLGALHSYAPEDSLLYNERFRRVAKEERYERDVFMRLASYQRKRNYEVFYQLYAAGLEDVLSQQRDTGAGIEATHPTTTAVAEYEQHRFDYILCNKHLSTRCEGIELLTDKKTRRISEHYPVMATFKLPANGHSLGTLD